MKARIIDFAVGLDGKQRVTLAVDGDLRPTYDELHQADVDLEIKKHRQKRSLSANGYCWALIDKLAAELGMNKIEVYQECIRDIGGVSETVCVPTKAVQRVIDGWKHNGLGWVADTLDSKIKGCTNVVLYYGSSTYDSKQMSALIDAVAQNCKMVGIETATPAELARLKDEWTRREAL